VYCVKRWWDVEWMGECGLGLVGRNTKGRQGEGGLAGLVYAHTARTATAISTTSRTYSVSSSRSQSQAPLMYHRKAQGNVGRRDGRRAYVPLSLVCGEGGGEAGGGGRRMCGCGEGTREENERQATMVMWRRGNQAWASPQRTPHEVCGVDQLVGCEGPRVIPREAHEEKAST